MAKKRKTPLGQEHKLADPIQGNLVANYLMRKLTEDFADLPPPDILLGLAIAVAFQARTTGAVPSGVVALVKMCLEVPMTETPSAPKPPA